MARFDAEAREKVQAEVEIAARRVMGTTMSSADSFQVHKMGGK